MAPPPKTPGGGLRVPSTPQLKYFAHCAHDSTHFACYTLPGARILFCHFISGAQLPYFPIGLSRWTIYTKNNYFIAESLLIKFQSQINLLLYFQNRLSKVWLKKIKRKVFDWDFFWIYFYWTHWFSNVFCILMYLILTEIWPNFSDSFLKKLDRFYYWNWIKFWPILKN